MSNWRLARKAVMRQGAPTLLCAALLPGCASMSQSLQQFSIPFGEPEQVRHAAPVVYADARAISDAETPTPRVKPNSTLIVPKKLEAVATPAEAPAEPLLLKPTIAGPELASFTPEPRRIVAPSNDGVRWAQLGAYSKQALAEEMWDEKRQSAPDILGRFAPNYETVETERFGQMIRLRVGPLSAETAETVCRDLQFECVVTK